MREGKAWLETHLWHAKRFRMDDNPKGLWGYRLVNAAWIYTLSLFPSRSDLTYFCFSYTIGHNAPPKSPSRLVSLRHAGSRAA